MSYEPRPDLEKVTRGFAALLASPLIEPKFADRVQAFALANESKLLRVVLKRREAVGVPAKEIVSPSSGLEPSDFYLRLIAATLANDWNFIGILEHEAAS